MKNVYLYHNSHMLKYRRPFGPAVIGTTVALSADVSGDTERVSLIVTPEGESPREIPMTRSGDTFSAALTVPEQPGLLWYHFALSSGEMTVPCGCARPGLGGDSALDSSADYQITVYRESATPEWFKNAVVYQVFPDRFFRGSDFEQRALDFLRRGTKNPVKRVLQADWDDKPYYTRDGAGKVTRWPFFGGTLRGVREKLPYLKSLGVSAIYLNPIFEASSNHRYDTADYNTVDPLLGDETEFRALAGEAEKQSIRLILDGVFSHTGEDSIYFDRFGNYGGKGAYSGKSSPYYEWYTFKSEDSQDEYNCWWGVSDLPEVREMTPSYYDFLCGGKDSVVRRWLRLGASGWRLDVADELPDAFLRGVRAACREEKPDSVLVGEVWEDASNKVSYGTRRTYFSGDELQSVMNYPFREDTIAFLLGEISAEELSLRLTSLMEHYPPENFYGTLNVIGSHDRARILTVLGGMPAGLSDGEKQNFCLNPEQLATGKKRLMLLSLLQFVSPGVPCIYYGDEAGVQGCEDPYNRAPFPWGREDQELLAHYKRISALRQKNGVLVSGGFAPSFFGTNVYAVTRSSPSGTEHMTILVNRSAVATEEIRLDAADFAVSDAFDGSSVPCPGALSLTLPPLGFRALRMAKK